jgi:hypothetical protein
MIMDHSVVDFHTLLLEFSEGKESMRIVETRRHIMYNDFDAIDSLVDEIKANTSFFGKLLIPRLRFLIPIVFFSILIIIQLFHY